MKFILTGKRPIASISFNDIDCGDCAVSACWHSKHYDSGSTFLPTMSVDKTSYTGQLVILCTGYTEEKEA